MVCPFRRGVIVSCHNLEQPHPVLYLDYPALFPNNKRSTACFIVNTSVIRLAKGR